MELAVDDLYIRNLDAIQVGAKVVFIGDDPFAPAIWETDVQTVKSVSHLNILVGCPAYDTHSESRSYENFRMATANEADTGLVNTKVQSLYVNGVLDKENDEDDADIDDSEDEPMPEFETEDENSGSVEQSPMIAEPKANDWAHVGMSNSIVTEVKVVVLEGCEDQASQILGVPFGTDVHRVTGHSVVDDTVTILGVNYPAVLFRYANNFEIESFGRDPDFAENAPRTIRDTFKEVARVQARMNTTELNNESLPLWVRAGLAIEYMDALNDAGSETLKYLEVELGRLKAISLGEKYKAIISYDEIQPLLPLLEHMIKRVGLEFHSGHTISYHIHNIRSTLGKVYSTLCKYPQATTNFKAFQDAEFEVYGGAENFFKLYANMDAFALVFSDEDRDTLHPSTFELSMEDLNRLIDVSQSVLLRYPLSDLTLNEDEWEPQPTGNTGHSSFQNKRYSRVFKDSNEDGSVELINELDVITFVDDLNLSVMYTNGNSVIIHPDAPFMPNKDVYIFVDETGAFKVPTIDTSRLVADKSIIMKHDGTVYNFKQFNKDDNTLVLEERSTGRLYTVTTLQLHEVLSFNRNKLFSVQVNPTGSRTPKTDLPYPAYHAVYNDGAPN